jgi:hypothetical protein
MAQPSSHGKRGRPPGTGKNDTDRLLKIASLMAADPGLRPTTAIKQIGETDPSTIRRLRDKYHEQQSGLAAALPTDLGPAMTADFGRAHGSRHLTADDAATEPAGGHEPVHEPSNYATVDIQHSPATTTAPAVAVEATSAPTVAKAAHGTPAAAFDTAPVQDPFQVFGKWYGNGIATAAALFEHQMMFAQTMMKTAPIKAIWRQQLVATEYLLLLSGPGQRIGATTSEAGKSL